MLLFIFSFYSHYGLFNCDETFNANFNESLIMDKHHQMLVQVNAVLKDVQKKIHEKSVLILDDYKAPGIDQKYQDPKDHTKLSADFLPSPQYDTSDRGQGLFHWLPPFFPGFEVPLAPFVMHGPKSPYPMGLFPLKNPGQRPGSSYPGYLLRPMHSKYPRQPPKFLSDYRYQNIYLRPPGPYLPSISYTPGPTRPKGLPFLYAVDRFHHKNPHLLNPLRPIISPIISNSAVSLKTPQPVTIPSSTIWTSTISNNAKIWLQEIAPYTPVNEKFKNTAKDQSPPYYSEETTVPVTDRMPKINDYWSSIGTANTGQLFNEDGHGFLYVTFPEKDGVQVQTTDPNYKNWMLTSAGDVLHGKITVLELSTPLAQQRYLDLMEELDEGYMMVFIIELCRMIAVKDRREVRDVLHHTEMIYNSLWDNGRLAWIGDPLETVLWKLSIMMSGRDIDLVRTHASMMFHVLLERNQTLSAEVNSIIDKADLFYNHDEGDRLLYSLKQFEDYPRTTKTSYWLCDSLIESFLVPFRRLSGTRRRQRLIESINKALKQRFPLLLREHNKGTLSGQVSTKNGSQTRKRKRKRHHLPHKKKRERKRHHIPEYNNTNIYGRQFSQDIDFKESILRTISPVTSDQPRFRVTTTKVYRTRKIRPTTAFSNLETRSTRNRKPSYQKTTSFQEKPDFFDRKYDKSTKKTVYPHHYFSRKTSTVGHRLPPRAATSTGPALLAFSGFHSPERLKRASKDNKPFYHQVKEGLKESMANKKDKSLKLKAELLIKITESSSYSDEEVSLVKNLNEALKFGNRTVEFVDETR